MSPIDDQTTEELYAMLEELDVSEIEMARCKTDEGIFLRLLEMQAVYSMKKLLREEAVKAYTENRLTMSSLIDEVSFSRPTLYKYNLLKKFAELLVKKSSENDIFRDMEQAILEKQDVERYNKALVSDILELLHKQEDYDRLVEQSKVQLQKIEELEAKIGVKSNVLPMEKQVKKKRNGLDGAFPSDLYRD